MLKKFLVLITLIAAYWGATAQTQQLDKARETALKGNLQEAKKIYEQILSSNPLSAPALTGLANVYASENKIDSAFIYYNKAAKLNYADAYFNLGKYYFNYKNDTKKALEYLQKAHKLSPDSSSYTLFMAMIYQAENKMDSAITYYKEVMNKEPENAYPYYFIGEYLYESDSLQMAYEFVNEAIKRNDKNYNFYDLKSSIEFKAGMYKEALESINKALAIKQLPKLQLRKAKILYALGNYSEAIKILKPLTEDKDINLNAYYFLGWSYYNLGQYDKALKIANNALAIDPNIPEFYELLAYTYLKTWKYKEAEEAADNLIALSPDYYQGYVLKVNAQLKQRTSKNILDANGYFYDLNLKNLATLKKMTEDKDSKYYYNKLMSKFLKSPDKLAIDEYFMLYLGYGLNNTIKRYDSKKYTSLYNSGNYTATINEALKAIESYPLDVSAYLYLANSYLKTGDKDKFLKYLTIYHGLLKGISASGTGTSPENAIIITDRDDEYYLIDYTKGSPQRAVNFGIKQVEKDGKTFEVIEIGFQPGKNFQIFFFNIKDN